MIEAANLRVVYNPSVASLERVPTREALAFHERLGGYAPTPLIDAPEIAALLGVGAVLLKNESERLGLPAFKILGASWAIYRALESRVGYSFEPWRNLEELARKVAHLRPMTLAAATDGNHGRAVAHMAAQLGFEARIFVPKGTAAARIEAIAGEGAHVEVIDGTYDDAVARSATEASDRCLVISDTSWPGYGEVPRSVMEGYSTIMHEIDDELAQRGEDGFDLIAVQFGVGALAAAVVQHYGRKSRPIIVSVEPLRAACMLESMIVGRIVPVPGPHDSIMAGLNCGQPSIVAWPLVSRRLDAAVAFADEYARVAMRALRRCGVVAGETGAAGLGALLAALTGPRSAETRKALHVDRSTRVLLFVTEGATDPGAYAGIMSQD